MKKLLNFFVLAALFVFSVHAQSELIPSAMKGWEKHHMPSTGTVRIPVFYIDFPDLSYESQVIQQDKIHKYVFDENYYKSVTNFYTRASYGNLYLTGDVFTATARYEIEYYETDDGYERLAMELMELVDDEVDFSSYDSDEDGYMDALVICVPGGYSDFWYGCTVSWDCYEDFEVDGVKPMKYVINDSQAVRNDIDYFLQTMYHELGHCMGLPDYYKYYTRGYEDDEAMSGYSGFEMMDEMHGDFSQFTKLQLGWLRDDQVQVYDGKEKKCFEIPKAAEGGCVVLFPKNQEDRKNFQAEYFVIEYNTAEGNLIDTFESDAAGVRVLHCQAETIYYEDSWMYRFSNFSPEYDRSNDGIRVIRNVADGMGFLKDGDSVVYGTGDFRWYDIDGGKYTIKVESIDPDKATVTIKPM